MPIATTVDTVTFGDLASEQSHAITTAFPPVQAASAPIPSATSATPASEVVDGAMGATARRLLPRTPDGDYYGGEINLRMNVDPLAQNYFTIKFWGSEASESWLVLEVEGYEVGGRHMIPDESILLNSSGYAPNRFIYRTVRLPWHLTRGKSSVAIRVRSIGTIAYYASGYDKYQKRMTSPTVSIYRAYTHTAPYLDVSAETQGSEPAVPRAAAATASDDATWESAWKTRVNNELTSKSRASAASVTADDMDYLAQGYGASWTSVYQSAAVIDKVIAAFDAKVTAYSAAPTTYLASKFPDFGGNAGWGGYFGAVGHAIVRLWPQLQSRLDVSVDYGGVIGTTTRRAAWATALRASLDYGRVNRKFISNQEIDAARRIYWANAGLRLVDVSQALHEDEARRYLYEAYGISPFLGNDQAGGGPVPVRGTAPYGPNWYMTTSRGTTKEDCLVGGDYGEQGSGAVLLGHEIGDAQLTAQGLKMLNARAGLRYAAADDAGQLVSYAVASIGCRNDHEVNKHAVYLARSADSVLLAGLGASVLGPDLMGYAQQQADEGQMLSQLAPTSAWLNGYAGAFEVVAVPEAYAAFKAQARTDKLLPMTPGQADFAWADEENMVIAAKRGEHRFWANLYWRGPSAINRLARVYTMTPEMVRLADVSIDHVGFTPTGATTTRDGSVDETPPYGYLPPDAPVNANIGLVLPIAMRADLSAAPATNRDAGRGDAYTLRYGHWLVAINAHPTSRYTMISPPDFSGGTDLVSGQRLGPVVTLAPKSAAVFFLDSNLPTAMTPSHPLMPRAIAGNAVTLLSWDAAPGASGYRILRAAEGDTAFTPVGTSSTTAHVDRSAVNGVRYWYAIQGVAPDGTIGGASPLFTATPQAGTLQAPWTNLDIGAVTAAGTTTLANDSFALTAQGAGLFGTADAMQMAYVPMLGDGSITARVVSQANTATQAHAAVTVRESLAAGSRHVSMVVTPGFGTYLRFRTRTGAATGNANRVAGLKAPYWIRLVRTGTQIDAYISPDGTTWTASGSQTLSGLSDIAYVGLLVGHGNGTAAGSATFDNVSVPALP